MAKQISQNTFDDVVRENMADFDMSAEEAVGDAVSQFEAQGVNLSTIVKDLSLFDSSSPDGGGGDVNQHPVVAAIGSLLGALKDSDLDKVNTACSQIKAECDKDIAHRCLAGKNDAYNILLQACEKFEEIPGSGVYNSCLESMCSLCQGQPDLLEDKGRNFVLGSVSKNMKDAKTVTLLVKFIRLTCTMAENNRQRYIAEGLIPLLMEVTDEHKDRGLVIREACSVLRVLTLDDDMRVPFGKAHDHAKLIVTEAGALERIMDICQCYIEDKQVLGELFSTLARLAVRDEFCQRIMDLGGLKLMLQTLEKNLNHPSICKQVLVVLQAIAGNDQVKIAIVTNGGLQLMAAAMTKHARHPGVCEFGCAAMTTVVLRNPAHCKAAMDCGCAEVIVKVMQLHPNEEMVQKQACMAVRNLVARTREFSAVFLELGVEAPIRMAGTAHQSCHDEAKAALRDLGCQVELKELWTGEGKGIHK